MVGRLVHYEKIGLRGKHFGDCNSFYLSSREVSHESFSLSEREICQNLDNPSFIGEKVLAIEVLCPFNGRIHYLTEDCLLRVKRVVLLQEGYSYILQKQDFPSAVGLVFPCQNP